MEVGAHWLERPLPTGKGAEAAAAEPLGELLSTPQHLQGQRVCCGSKAGCLCFWRGGNRSAGADGMSPTRAGEKAGGAGRTQSSRSQVGAAAQPEQQWCQTNDPRNLVSWLRQRPAPAVWKSGKWFARMANGHSLCSQRISFRRSGIYAWTVCLHLRTYQLRLSSTQLKAFGSRK